MTLSKQQSRQIPPVPHNFSLDSKTLFKLFVTEREPEKGDKINNRKLKKRAAPRPLSHLIKLSTEDRLELKYINAIRSLQQNNDPALQNMEIPMDKNCMTNSESIKFENTKVNSMQAASQEENQLSSEPAKNTSLLELQENPFSIYNLSNVEIETPQ